MNDGSPRLQRARMAGSDGIHVHNENLIEEIQRLQHLTCIGQEAKVEWLPSSVKYYSGKQLAEEAIGDTIFIYTKNPAKSMRLVPHDFAERTHAEKFSSSEILGILSKVLQTLKKLKKNTNALQKKIKPPNQLGG